MLNRREFFRSTALPLAALPSLGLATAGGAVPFHAVYDVRIGKLAARWRQARKLVGARRVHAFDGDVTALWRDTLEPLWSTEMIATEGLTRYAEFFILSTLAKDHGYAIASTIRHPDHVLWLLQKRDRS